MKVSQILNNNVAVVKRGSQEVIVYSKGISFKKRPGDSIELSEIDKTYVLDSHDKLEHFSYLLTNTKEEYMTKKCIISVLFVVVWALFASLLF